MKRSTLWQVSVCTSPEAEDALAARFELIFDQPAVSFRDLEKRLTTVSVYLSERPRDPAATRGRILAALKETRQWGLNPAPGRVSVHRVRRRDWAESWKRHFAPLEIGSALLLKPSWSRRRPRQGQVAVVLDPGLSFGTGRHPTTAFCLEQLVRHGRRPALSFLDLGTGSGLLAIAAAKLGCAPVQALDLDSQALLTARANARRNRVAQRIRFSRRDVARLKTRPARHFSLVCANLTADLLVGCSGRIVAQLKPGGILVLAGILKDEFPQVRSAYAAAGMSLLTSRLAGEWRSGAFVRI